MIPAGFLQELISRVDIVDIVGRHVELKRGGANFMGLCPFHGEKSPSFSVSPSKQFYYCFGCGASGDALRFLTEHLGLSFVEAVRDLAQGVGLAVPEEQVSPEERERRDTLRQRRLSLAEVLAKAADFYRAQLKAQPRAIDYLKKRGLTGAVAARFGLGFAPPGWRSLAGVFPSYDDPLLEEAGLVRSKDAEDGAANVGGNGAERGRYDWFRERVMFPIRSVDGSVVGFGGRVLDDSKPKYMNSPETPVFSKGRELYGLFEARQALRDKGYALVVEGYMDVVALAQSGFANAVATLGTACTAEHVQKLFRFTDSVVFSFDGDAAGRRAAGRALEASLPHASDLRSVKFLFLPPEHDPDSYVRELGAAAFEQQVAQAVPLSRQLAVQAADDADLDTAEGRARMLAQAKPLWQALPDGALKRQLLGELARLASLELADVTELWKLGHGEAALRGAAAVASGSTSRPTWRAGPGKASRSATRKAPTGPAEQAMRMLMLHSAWWDELSTADHELLHALPPPLGELCAWLERQLAEHGTTPWAALAEGLAGDPLESTVRALVTDAALEDEMSVADLQRMVDQLWERQLEAERARLSEIAHTDPDARQRWREVDLEWRRRKGLLRGA